MANITEINEFHSCVGSKIALTLANLLMKEVDKMVIEVCGNPNE